MSFGENATVIGKNRMILSGSRIIISYNTSIVTGTAASSSGNSPTLSVTTLIFPGDNAITWENTSIFPANREKLKPIMKSNGGDMT